MNPRPMTSCQRKRMDRRQLQMYNRLLNHKEKLNYFIKNGTDDLKGNNQNYSNKVIKIIKKK